MSDARIYQEKALLAALAKTRYLSREYRKFDIDLTVNAIRLLTSQVRYNLN